MTLPIKTLCLLLTALCLSVAQPMTALAQDASEEAAADDAADAAQEQSDNAQTTAVQNADVQAAEGATDAPLQTQTNEEWLAALSDPEIPRQELALRLMPLTVAELDALAQQWQRIVQGQTAAVVAEQLAINAAEADGRDTVSRERLTALTDVRARGFANFSTIVESYALKGGDPDKVAEYRAYRNAIVVEETQAADWRTLLARGLDWATDEEGGIQFAIRVAVIASAFVALVIAARFIRGIARRSFRRVPNLSKLLQAFFVMVIYWLTLAVGLLIVLGALGVNISPLFALFGGASFILAFAMQDTLGNLAAGLMIMFNRPFDVGDYVTIAGTGGTVQSVSVVSTTVTTPDNQVIVIPNSKVWGDIITNVTASETRRVDLVFGIGYDDDIETAQKVLERVVADHPLTMDDPAPTIRVAELADSSVNFICRPWARTEDYWTVYWDLMRDVKQAFDKAGISIPFPQTDMHIRMPAGSTASPLTPALAAPAGATHVKDHQSISEGDEGHTDAATETEADGGDRT